MSKLSAVTVPPTGKHTATVFILHGLGDTGHGWADVADMLAAKLPWIKWVLPHAPSIAVTLNYGMSMPAWYDIPSLDQIDKKEDEAGMKKTVDKINSWIIDESKTVPESRIVLGGFSQGCAMALLTDVLSRSKEEGGIGKLAGFFGMSGYLPLAKKAIELMSPANPNLDTPLAMFHGTDDAVVPHFRGSASRDRLKELGFKPEWKEYRGLGHSANLEEIQDIERFLLRVLPKQD
ncbi:Phospholipase/carboxylesterase/thioesterase [Hyaloraphidium curvatum]|nr:Phospholipase/carboxylesterase/thioesterase [Hyaloraphidium curvatum]